MKKHDAKFFILIKDITITQKNEGSDVKIPMSPLMIFTSLQTVYLFS